MNGPSQTPSRADHNGGGGSHGFFPAADPRMLEIKELARRVAPTDAPVLIIGESGVGKEVLARFIHAAVEARAASRSSRSTARRCPHDLLESELFGHERGAFTGAHPRQGGEVRAGRRRARILLDEIGEMTPPLQAKLLHVLAGRRVHAASAATARSTSTRAIMATTNIQLEEAVRERRASGEDLYFRLNVIRIEVPPLRERRGRHPAALRPLPAHLRRTYHSAVRDALPRALREAFLRYDWPGNVRELENAVRRYVILPDVEMVLSDLASRTDARERSGRAGPAADRISAESSAAAARSLAQGDRGARRPRRRRSESSAQVLDETRWNRRRAAVAARHLLQDAAQQAAASGSSTTRPTAASATHCRRRGSAAGRPPCLAWGRRWPSPERGTVEPGVPRSAWRVPAGTAGSRPVRVSSSARGRT